MLERMKRFFKKYRVFVSIAFVVTILFVLMLALLLQDDTVDENGDDIVIEDPTEFQIVRQPLGYHKNYEISFTSSVFNQIVQKEGNYPGFAIRDVSHFGWAENFVNQIGKGNLDYTTDGSVEGHISHYWENDSEWVTYDEGRDFFFMKFQTPISIPEITFNPKDKSDLEEGLTNLAANYFSSNFEYTVSNVDVSDNFYRVEYSRVLQGSPIHLEMPREYLVLTSDGRLKEGAFLLAEFVEYTEMQYPLISAENLRNKISLMEYPKNVEFSNLDPEVEEQFYTHGYTVFSDPFTQEGTVEVNEMELVYFYVGLSQKIVVPTFLFKGEGLLDVEGNLERADFNILASAIASEYVYVHPQSHFDTLESLE